MEYVPQKLLRRQVLQERSENHSGVSATRKNFNLYTQNS